jgi:hypothetical protein
MTLVPVRESTARSGLVADRVIDEFGHKEPHVREFTYCLTLGSDPSTTFRVCTNAVSEDSYK